MAINFTKDLKEAALKLLARQPHVFSSHRLVAALKLATTKSLWIAAKA
jgi:hypothetical protein